jgi:choline dehydrogenase
MFTAGVTLVSVASRGSLRLRSSDPAIHPAIDPAYFDDQVDLDAMLAGMRETWQTCQQGPLSRFLDRSWEVPDDPSDDDLLEHVRRRAQTLFHPVATCAMGTGEDAVVDPSLVVRGVAGLRGVDASVMPGVPRGNTNAATIMIAEKSAEEIRKNR